MFSSAIMMLTVSVCFAAPSLSQDQLRDLINPPLNSNKNLNDFTGSASPSSTTATTDNKMIGELVRAMEKQPITSVQDLEQVLTTSVKSQLVASLANMSPEQVSTITGAANPNELSQLNLMGGINSLVRLIVKQILQSLLSNILGQNSAPTPNVGTGMGFPMAGGFTPQQPFGGMFGAMGSMFPMNMMMPGMMFNFMDNLF